MSDVHSQKDLPVELERKDTDADADADIDNVVLDPKKERRLLLKLDCAFIPIIMLTYLTCFLDRSNIGWLPEFDSPYIYLTAHRKRQSGRYARGH
jgi:hypothetical protein